MLALLLTLLQPAFAQEPPTTPTVASSPLEQGIGARFAWEHRGSFRQRGAVTGIAVSPPDGDGLRTWIAVDEAGWAWRSTDEGASWVVVLRGDTEDAEPDDEEILLNAEVLRDEALKGADIGETPDLSDLRDQAAAASQQATRDVGMGDGKRRGAEPRVWFHPTDPNVALLGRADGTWRSEDGGLDWELVDPVATTAFYAAGKLVVAGTTDGVRWSLDGGTAWFDVEDATDGATVNGLGRAGSWIYAATSRGLFRSADGLSWQVANALRGEPTLDVVPDPSWPGGAWVVTREGLMRTDDDGANFYPVDRDLLRDVRRIAALPGRGHLLALTGDGPWESTDGGVKWIPAQRLLRDPDVRDVTLVGGWPILAARTGVYRLVEPVQLADRARALPMPPVADLVRIAQSREGLKTDLLALGRLRVVAMAVPVVTLTYDRNTGAGRTGNFRTRAYAERERGDWSLTATACWGGCASASSEAAYLNPEDLAALDSAELFVIGDEVYDPNDSIAAAANVAQNIRTYRQTVASAVAEAWTARQRLNQEQAVVDLLPLKDRVLHALAIAESDARLDLYTDGAYSRAFAALQAESPEP